MKAKASMTSPSMGGVTEPRRSAGTDWVIARRWQDDTWRLPRVSLSVFIILAVLRLVLTSHGRWRSTGRSSAARGASVRQTPSAVPPASQRTADWAPHCHRWWRALRLPLPHSAHWRRSSCCSQRLRRARAWRRRSSHWCSEEDWGGDQTPGHLTPKRHQRRVPVGHRDDLWPGGRCGKGPWCHREGWVSRPSAPGSGRGSVQDRGRHRWRGGAQEGREFALEGRSEGLAEGSLPPN